MTINNLHKPHNLRENVLQRIHRERLVMKPRLYFTLKLTALILVVLAILGISIFLINFIFFSIRINNQDTLLGFGPRGFTTFLHFFPWSWFIIDLILIAGLQWILRRFRFGYKIPALYLLAGICAISALVGIALDKGTNINDRILRRAEVHRLPAPFIGLYGQVRKPFRPKSGVCKCMIVSIDKNVLIVEDTRSGTTTIRKIILPMDDARATSTLLEIGDSIFIAGDERDDIIYAFGIRKIGDHPQIFKQKVENVIK